MSDGVMSHEVPDVYEGDLRDVVAMIEKLKACAQVSDLFVIKGRMVLWNANDYPVGVLTYEDEQWRFTPHADWAQEPLDGVLVDDEPAHSRDGATEGESL